MIGTTWNWGVSQFNCMTLSWWPCHKIVSVTFTFTLQTMNCSSLSPITHRSILQSGLLFMTIFHKFSCYNSIWFSLPVWSWGHTSHILWIRFPNMIRVTGIFFRFVTGFLDKRLLLSNFLTFRVSLHLKFSIVSTRHRCVFYFHFISLFINSSEVSAVSVCSAGLPPSQPRRHWRDNDNSPGNCRTLFLPRLLLTRHPRDPGFPTFF